MTPAIALNLLKEGNSRFVSGKMKNRNFLQQAKLTKKGQHPFAFILSCMDSRGSPELIFDQGIGDIFAGRVAGNVINDDQLGGMEFATQVMGAHIIVVMGHTSCGAVKGACSHVTLGNLTQLVNKITPAVNTVKKDSHTASLDCDKAETVDMIAKQNVLNMIQQITEKSPVVKKLVDDNQVIIVGAMHNLATGVVTFI
ncbi:carbonic anhydrase [Gammaproteobacteria bacterium SCGC AG-212-F23]|nr:carbonic anhydrase [Gammaproteobacteria bacterium SCGC AG-212-F23]